MPIPSKPLPDSSNDGTRELLSGGGVILAIGLISFFLLMTAFGGVNVEGAHSNPGWLALIIAAMCLPFGLLIFSLGFAKWLRNRGRIHNN